MEDGVQESSAVAEEVAKGEGGGGGGGGGGWGWGGWGTSALSVFSDLQKAAADVAEEISKNAVAAAKGAAKGVADLQQSVVESIDQGEEETAAVTEESKVKETEPSTPEEALRKAALDKLESASKDSILGQGLKVFDESVENITSGALQAFGNAWKGSVSLVQKLEHSAENLAGSIQQGGFTSAGSIAPSILEGGMALTARGFKVLEYVGKETLDMLAAETGIEFEKDSILSKQGVGDEEGYNEEVTFDHCFYIYGGPEHLEELEALSNHYTLLCNRARAKLVGEPKITFDATLKQLQSILALTGDGDEGAYKGKKVEAESSCNGSELKALRESSISKAAEMATGFTAALGGLAMKEVVKKTSDRLEAIKAEGVHRVSELCAMCISHLLVLGKSVLTTSTTEQTNANGAEDFAWPEDCIGKASLISARARAMAADIEAVSDSFITGVVDVTAAFQTTVKNVVTTDDGEDVREGLLNEGTMEDRAQAVRSDIEIDGSSAIEKIQDGLQHLTYVVLSTSLGS